MTSPLVCVTGATSGIGLAVAKIFLASGATIIGVGRRAAELKRLAKALGPRFIPKAADLSRRPSLTSFCRWLSRQPVETLVCNAGANKISDIRSLKDADWDDLLELNLTAPALLSRAVAAGMARRGYGRIVHVSSVYGLVSKKGRSAYSSGKSGLLGLTRAAALDLAPHGVLVNAVCPGFTDTALTRSILKGPELAAVLRLIPLGRMAKPQEIARLIQFLGSRENSYITGQAIAADGGFTAA